MKVAFYALTDEDLFLHRLPVARNLRDAGYEVAFAAPAGPHTEQIQNEGFSFHRVVDAGRSVIGDVAATMSLRLTLRQEDPDILHTFGLRAALRGGLAARMHHLPWVVHSVSRGHSGRRPPPFLKIALSDAEVTFRLREDRDAFIARRYVRPEQTHVLRSSGVDLRTIPQTDEPDRKPVAALVSPEPGDLDFFGGAARKLAEEGIDARFAVIGTAYTPDMRARLQTWQEEGVVEWWGERDELTSTLANTHVICLPMMMSERDRILASAAGRPLVTAAKPQKGDVLRAGDSSVILRSRDADQLAATLRELIGDRDKRIRMGRRAREIVEEEFSAKRVAREIMAVYERLFEKGRAV